MNRTFNRYFGLMLLLVVAAELALAQQPPIKIGALNALSGSFATYGKSGRQGAQLAIDEINASGGLLGRKLELIQVDDQAKPDVGVQEAKRLILNEKVNFLIGIDSSSVALAVAPLTNEYKIPLVVTHGATPALTEQCNPYVFRTSNNARMDAFAAADLAAKLPYKRWANIGPDYEFGHSSWNDFIARLKEKRPDVEVVGEQWPKGGESNYTPYITALVQQRPEAVFSALWAGDLVTFVRQANAFGFFKQIKLFEDPIGAALESIGPSDHWARKLPSENSSPPATGSCSRNPRPTRNSWTPITANGANGPATTPKNTTPECRCWQPRSGKPIRSMPTPSRKPSKPTAA
jgi:branched-chain amino acid transport system substrate-binding protein